LNISADFGSVNPSSGWHDTGSKVNISATAPTTESDERYVWKGWIGSGNGTYVGVDAQATVTMISPVTETASWTHQYMLTVNSVYGLPTPSTDWFDAGTPISASVGSPVAGSIISNYACIGWTGTGSAPTAGKTTKVQFALDQPSSITWNWEIQYYLPTSLLAAIILIAVLTGSAAYVVLRRKGQKRKMTARDSYEVTQAQEVNNVFDWQD
jgi:hypothetical protein